MTQLILHTAAAGARMTRGWLQRQRGDISFYGVIAGLLLGISYLVYPDMYHNFVRFLIDYLFDALHDAFGGDPPKGTQTDKGTKN